MSANLFFLITCIFLLTQVYYDKVLSAPTSEQDQLDDMAHDDEHLQEHMTAETGKNVTEMTTSEKEFYFFHSHDENEDRLLDGLELYHSMEHTLAHSRNPEKNMTKLQQKIIDMVDKMLLSEDLNNDGYIDYVEYAFKRQQDAKTRPQRDKKKQRPQRPPPPSRQKQPGQQQPQQQPNLQYNPGQQAGNPQFQQQPNQQFQQPNQQFQQPNQQFQQPNQQFQQPNPQFQQQPNQQFQQPPPQGQPMNQQFQQQQPNPQFNQQL